MSVSVFFISSHQVLTPSDKILPDLSLHQVDQPQPSQPPLLFQMLQALDHFHDPLLDLLQNIHVPLVQGASIPDVLSPVLIRGTRTSAGTTVPNGAQKVVGLFCHKDTLLVHGQLVFQDPNVFLSKAAFQSFSPSLCWCMGSFFPRGRALHFPSLNFMKVLSAQFSSLFRSL